MEANETTRNKGCATCVNYSIKEFQYGNQGGGKTQQCVAHWFDGYDAVTGEKRFAILPNREFTPNKDLQCRQHEPKDKGTSKQKNILVFDAEKDGMPGKIFAIGAVILDAETQEIVDQFSVQVDLAKPENKITSTWVLSTIMPDWKDLETIVDDEKTLILEFWSWYLKQKSEADQPWDVKDTCSLWADYANPVEGYLLWKAIEYGFNTDGLNGPLPLHECETLLTQAFGPDCSRREVSGLKDLVPHNPVHDSYASGVCVLKAIEKLGLSTDIY